ncbi:hypothetical protein GCM10010124_28450 [Pilimelia terevasa]|uniref:HAMP domain-containing protein n=1 Tax=Pilimelia terevasa TaxID=53372 RepID=A0A8J3BNE4_9ACTN|nr:HAMP domain-containing protein [Pilimelia terevasa]GGK34154.1 hypothetical protein GCM10010124_28450 [Pilimelia terevasa]
MSPDVLAWRRECLDRQLPRPAFPSGIAVPGAVAAAVVALVGLLGAGLLYRAGAVDAQAAVVASQRESVADLGQGLAANLERQVDALAGAAARGDDAAALVAGARQAGWTGAAVWHPATRATDAASGQPVPLEIPESWSRTTTPRRTGTAGGALVARLPVGADRVLTAVRPILTRDLRLDRDTAQTLVLAGLDGAPLQRQGSLDAGAAPWRALVARAIAAQDGGRPGTATGPARHTPFGSRTPVVTAAPVGQTGDSVVSLVHLPPSTPWSMPAAWWVAAGGLALAAAVWALGTGGLVRPLRHLLAALRSRACDAPAPARAAGTLAEAREILAAVGPVHRRGRGAVPAAAVVVATALLVAGGAVAVTQAYAHRPDAVPAPLLSDVRNRVDGALLSLRETLVRGRDRVARAAAAWPADDRQGAPLLQELVTAGTGLRSAYLTEPDGRRTLAAGEDPYRPPTPAEDGEGVRLDRRVDHVPAVYAQARLRSGRLLAAEFDPRALLEPLQRAQGRVRVVDDRRRTVLDTDGYIAFSTLDDPAARRAARAAAAAGDQPTAVTPEGQVLTSVRLRDARLPALDWTLVAAQPVSALGLPETQARRAARMLAAALASVAVGLLLWQTLVVVLPLRRLRGAARRLARGDTATPVTPLRFDEIGALAICLEVWRQGHREGGTRWGAASRLYPGAATPPAESPRTAPAGEPEAGELVAAGRVGA